MTSAYFTIGSKCNHSCVFCPCKWEQRNKEIDVSVFEERIQELEAQKHIHSITLSGGEPTIQHNFFDLLKWKLLRFYSPMIENRHSNHHDYCYCNIYAPDIPMDFQ